MWRFLANLLLFFGVLFLPWWVSALVGLVFLFTFRSFYEIIFWGLVGDVLYGTKVTSFFGIDMILTLGALILFAIVRIFKKHIRFYDEREA